MDADGTILGSLKMKDMKALALSNYLTFAIRLPTFLHQCDRCPRRQEEQQLRAGAPATGATASRASPPTADATAAKAQAPKAKAKAAQVGKWDGT